MIKLSTIVCHDLASAALFISIEGSYSRDMAEVLRKYYPLLGELK